MKDNLFVIRICKSIIYLIDYTVVFESYLSLHSHHFLNLYMFVFLFQKHFWKKLIFFIFFIFN